MEKLFKGAYKGKNVLVTGHTGFKGSWLTLWLDKLGANVTGYSAYMPSNPCNFEVTGLKRRIRHITGDIRDINKLDSAFKSSRPEIVFHLAAQPIVKASYADPKKTFDTNIGGTVNVLECIRKNRGIKSAVIITSDKCYRNFEWARGYREDDILGGDDPYSASKACAEIVSNSYIKSFFGSGRPAASAATTRAGNVIGGGDWAEARIVPDCVRAWSKGKTLEVRNPSSTRPWQHVLEPLSGYLWLGAMLYLKRGLSGEAFNFGPDQKTSEPVSRVIGELSNRLDGLSWKHVKPEGDVKESVLLKLSCRKARRMLKWRPVLSFKDTMKLTADWYREYYGGNTDMAKLSEEQIEAYADRARELSIEWAR